MRGKADVADIAFLWIRRSYGGAAARGGGARQRSWASRRRSARLLWAALLPRTIRERCYCVRNLYATIRATMLAKISSAERDFRIIGLVEWRAADRPG